MIPLEGFCVLFFSACVSLFSLAELVYHGADVDPQLGRHAILTPSTTAARRSISVYSHATLQD
jgi:hypothetical protein